jgi:hypothetical protein
MSHLTSFDTYTLFCHGHSENDMVLVGEREREREREIFLGHDLMYLTTCNDPTIDNIRIQRHSSTF